MKNNKYILFILVSIISIFGLESVSAANACYYKTDYSYIKVTTENNEVKCENLLGPSDKEVNCSGLQSSYNSFSQGHCRVLSITDTWSKVQLEICEIKDPNATSLPEGCYTQNKDNDNVLNCGYDELGIIYNKTTEEISYISHGQVKIEVNSILTKDDFKDGICPDKSKLKITCNYTNNNSTCKIRYNNTSQNQSGSENQGESVEGCGLLGTHFYKYLQKIFDLIQIIGPILALVLGLVDLLQALANGEEDSKKKATKKVTQRFTAALLLYFIPAILEFILSLSSKVSGSTCGIK